MGVDTLKCAPAAAWQHAFFLDELPVSSRLDVAPALPEELPAIAHMISEYIPNIKGNFAAFKRVHAYSDSILCVKVDEEIVGCFACLFLNRVGLCRLLEGSLSMSQPEEASLARAGERASAIYAWAICLPTIGLESMGNIMRWLCNPEYTRVDIYARPTTPKGAQFLKKLHFRPVADWVKDRSLLVGYRQF